MAKYFELIEINMSIKRILINSDIHIGEENDSSTNLTVATPELPTNRNPMESLKDFLLENNIEIDAILNLGDVTNKGYSAGWYAGIRMLRELSLKFDCPLISTPGNHDYVLNAEGKFADTLFKGVKDYPTPNDVVNGNFWSEGFCIYEHQNFQFLICNSELHLKTKDDLSKSPEYTEDFLSRIKDKLHKMPFDGIRIAIMHHHIIQHSDLNNPQKSDVIDNGDRLLKILQDEGFFCVVHGHKHQPRIVLWDNINIIASGSLASTQNTYISMITNHFHILVFDVGKSVNASLESYKFIMDNGCQAITDTAYNIQPVEGLGYNGDIRELTTEILNYYSSEFETRPFLSTKDIVRDFPLINSFSKKQKDDFCNICKELGYEIYIAGFDILLMKKK